MENISFTIVLHKHVDWRDTIFDTMKGPFFNNPPRKLIVVIRIGTYQKYAGDRHWVYELVSDLCTYL